MTRGNRIDPEELLSAYADGGLSADEQREVEAYLDDHPEERGELERYRDTLREAKALSPSVKNDPDWERISAAISTEIDAVEAERANTWGARLWRWVRRPTVMAGFGVAAVAAATIAILVLRSSGGPTDPSPTTDDVMARDDKGDTTPALHPHDDDGDTTPSPPTADEGDILVAELDELDEDELDALIATIDGDASGDDVFGDLLAEGDVLGDDWSDIDDAQADDDSWLDELDDDEIEALDRYLDSIQAG